MVGGATAWQHSALKEHSNFFVSFPSVSPFSLILSSAHDNSELTVEPGRERGKSRGN